jgi:hypothetical protein
MIKIRISKRALLDRIAAAKPRWLANAKIRARRAVAALHVNEADGTWSAIKSVFIELQHHKCAYCESPLAQPSAGATDAMSVDYDVDHFRPKNRVTPWPTENVRRRRGGLDYASRVRSGAKAGYVRFAFEPGNFLVACKVCNTGYKRDRFPIAGRPDTRLLGRMKLDAKERPMLLFPLGAGADDPEKFLAFLGPIPRARPSRGLARLRARTIIDFFELDTREDLLEARCHVVMLLWPQLEIRRTSCGVSRMRARAFVSAARADRFPHAACVRSFVTLHEVDRRTARRVFEAARAYVTSREPSAGRDDEPDEATP